MADFLLIHGMCVGAWEWERLIPALQADARTGMIVAPDLPGRGSNRPGEFATIRLADYVATCVAALRDNDLRDTIVVGHSGGGASVQAVAAAEPERVRRMVFLCAAVPKRGRSLLDLQPRPLRLVNRALLTLFQTRRRGIRPIRRLAQRGICNDLRPEDCERILDRLVPEPQALLVDRLDWSPDRVRAPATYILTRLDRVIRPTQQAQMARNVPGAQVVTFNMGHARPTVEPEQLASLLLSYS